MPTSPKQYTILVVEDDPISQKLLDSHLKKAGYLTLLANDGNECLQVVREQVPDLILSDFMMPGMDGPELCTRLKKDPALENVPIILVTARADTKSKVIALEAGAVDYITKPIEFQECLARVRTHLQVKEVNQKNIQLNLRLSEIRKEASIGAISQGISHNLNNMLASISLCNDSIKLNSKNPEKVEQYTEKISKTLGRLVAINKQLQATLDTQKPVTEKGDIHDLIEGAMDQFRKVDQSNISIELLSSPQSFRQLTTSNEYFERIILELLKNARESYPAQIEDDHQIIISYKTRDLTEGHFLDIMVFDRGRGIPKGIKPNIFEPFISSKETVGHGLGLAIAKQMAEQLGGQLKLDHREEGGTIAIFSHPI